MTGLEKNKAGAADKKEGRMDQSMCVSTIEYGNAQRSWL